MGLLSGLLGSSVAAPVEAVGRALDSLFTSDDEREKAKFVLEKLRQQPHILQAEINKLDAQSKNWFQAGWRPGVGWVCCLGFLYVTLVSPILQQLFGLEMPEVPSGIITDTMFALLGLGGLRTYEKIKGKT